MKLTQEEKVDKLIRYLPGALAEHFARKLTGDDVRALVLAFRAENAQSGEREARHAAQAISERTKSDALTAILARVEACVREYEALSNQLEQLGS